MTFRFDEKEYEHSYDEEEEKQKDPALGGALLVSGCLWSHVSGKIGFLKEDGTYLVEKRTTVSSLSAALTSTVIRSTL